MPTIMSHAVVPLAAAVAMGRTRISMPVIVTAMVLAMVPDADVLGFKLGVKYADTWGHRGATHSIIFAAFVAAIVTAAVHPVRWRLVWPYLFAAMASHGLRDMMTNGGLGAAILWPFSNERYFATVQPIRVSPIGAAFFSDRARVVMLSELRMIWVPAIITGLSGWELRKYFGRAQKLA